MPCPLLQKWLVSLLVYWPAMHAPTTPSKLCIGVSRLSAFSALTRRECLQVSSPMDLSTLLMRVDQRRYPTLAAYMADLRSVAAATQEYWAGEARGAREVH
jgi:hypothetical protein